MYVSLNRSMIGAAEVSWPAFVELAGSAGFAGVDLPPLRELVADGTGATRERLAAAGVRAGGCNLPVEFRRDQASFEADFGSLDELCRLASDLGVTVMCRAIPASSAIPKDELRPVIRERLTSVAEVLKAYGLRIGLEFFGPLHLRRAQPYAFIWQMNEAVELARECGPNVGLLLDSWHWHHAGATYADIVDAADAVFHVQIADAPDLPAEEIIDLERLAPGEGVIDFDAFFSGLQAIGYEGAVSPEVFGERLAGLAPEEGAQLGLETASAVMTATGIAPTKG